jgi:protocatechuate 3,4-dioxygenase beta subunit
MGTKTQLIAGAALCSGLYLAWRALPPDAAESRPAIAGPAAATPAPAEISPTHAAEPPAPMPAPRAPPPIEPAAAMSETAAPAPETPRTVAGAVIDLEGRPVPGVLVGFLPPEAGHPDPGSPAPSAAARATAVSGADGGFELAAEGAALVLADGTAAFGHVTVLDPAWSAVFEPLGSRLFGAPGTEDQLLLVVAPSVRLAGRVSDPTGAGVAGAELQMSLQRWDFPSLPEAVQGLRLVSRETTADDRGQFELLAFGAPKAYLMTQAPGFAPDVRQPPTVSTDGLAIVLERPTRGAELLAGIVVDPAGAPIEGARVALGFEQARSDGDGRFVLRLSRQSPDTTLAALKPGYLPAIVERRGPDTLAPDAWPEPLVLALGGPPLELAGRVLDAEGEPLEGIEVQLVDKTEFGAVEIPGQPFMTSLAHIEDLLDGGDAHGPPPRTDAMGRFAIRGLLPRAYTLRAVDRERLLAAEFGPFDAGSTGLVLRLSPAPLIPRVAGRVVDLGRRPLAGVTASAIAWIGSGEHGPQAPRAPRAFGEILYGPSTACDADGRFAFEGLSTAATHLAFHGEEIAFTEPLAIPPGADLENLEFQLPRRCRLRVELGPENAHGSFELHDTEGRPVMLFQMEGEYAYSTDSGMIGPEGNSETYSAPETAALCVVQLHGGRTLELPVQLVPGEVTLIRP